MTELETTAETLLTPSDEQLYTEFFLRMQDPPTPRSESEAESPTPSASEVMLDRERFFAVLFGLKDRTEGCSPKSMTTCLPRFNSPMDCMFCGQSEETGKATTGTYGGLTFAPSDYTDECREVRVLPCRQLHRSMRSHRGAGLWLAWGEPRMRLRCLLEAVFKRSFAREFRSDLEWTVIWRDKRGNIKVRPVEFSASADRVYHRLLYGRTGVLPLHPTYVAPTRYVAFAIHGQDIATRLRSLTTFRDWVEILRA